MSRWRRIGWIYRKELLEILRDRRTLTAMVVIPVVLYPLLMLGFLRAAESEQQRLKVQKFIVAVADESAADELHAIIQEVRRVQEIEDPGPQRGTFEVHVGTAPPEELGDGVQLQVKLTDTLPAPPRQGLPHIEAEITYNEVNVHSRTAMEQLSEVLREFARLATRERLQQVLSDPRLQRGPEAGVNVDMILQPVEINTVSVATNRQRGGWALGQIIPIILVLMTITGSVYPAIDLTAGERERGTLETLMVTPVPTLHLILGKFLVVATVGILTAALNVGSVAATMHFSGITRSITQEMPVEVPLDVLPIILFCMIPFSLLFAALLVAVCSFARTFKEAQSYVMPVILGALIPAVAVTLPSVRLSGILLVMPVGNMVLLARELFEGSRNWGQIIIVLLSTSLYAAAAVGVAVRLFGQEAVVFADAGSYKTLLLRRYCRPSPRPTTSQALLMAALVFPASFYAQFLVMGSSGENFLHTLKLLAVVQFAGLFVLLPLAVTLYYKIDPLETFRLRLPPARTWLGVLLLGVSSWAVAQEFLALQSKLVPPGEATLELMKRLSAQLETSPLWVVLLLLAVAPAIAEELFFRGFVLSGLRQNLSKWWAILLVSLTFGIYHFMIDRVPVTAMMGVVLAYLCWQSGSILPGIVFHILHNGLLMYVASRHPGVIEWFGIKGELQLLPIHVVVPAVLAFAAGLVVVASIRQPADVRAAHQE